MLPPPPEPPKRKSRVAIIVGSAVAVLAVVVAGTLFLTQKDKDRDKRADKGDDGKKQSALGSVPKEFVGKWSGSVVTQNGVPSTVTITIRAGKVGAVVARDESVLPLFNTNCSGDWKLRSATTGGIVLDNRFSKNPHPGICSNGSNNERFTLKSADTLHYESGDSVAGRPKGDLKKTK